MLNSYTPATLVALVLAFCTLSLGHIIINPENLEHMRNMAKSMDPTADPCNDFHQYACGNGVATIDNVAYSGVTYFLNILALLQKDYPITRKVNQHYTEKLQIYYITGVKAENAPLLPFLDEVKPEPLPEWPLLEEMQAHAGQNLNHTPHNWTTNDFNVLGLLAQLNTYGLNDVLITYKMLFVDGKEYLVLQPPPLTAAPSNEVLMLLASTKLPRSIVEKYYIEFMEIHQYLQSIYKEYPQREYAHVTYSRLEPERGIWGHLAKYLKRMLPHPAKIEDQDIMFHKYYFYDLLRLKWQPDETRKLCNYFMFQLLVHLKDSVVPGYHLVSAETKFALAVNYLHYKHFYLPQQEQEQELQQSLPFTIKTLYKTFADAVAENRLNLTAQQVQEITTKFNKIKTNIGNLPTHVNDSMVEDYYSHLPDFDVNNYYKNELILRKHDHLETLICPTEMICQELSPHAFYVPDSNMIVFPFTALQLPMYDRSWHPIFAMSILGIAAGHELLHTIDSSALNDAVYTPSFGGDSLQVPSINAAITCLSQQSPTISANERLADVIGVQMAFRSYSREFSLQPKFTSTPWQQLFFVSLAQSFCGEPNDADTQHDPFKIRLHEIVINSQEFAEAFQCPAGSNMNPAKKCTYI